MFSLNRVQIIGYQTQPVTIRQTPNGSSVTDLNIVTPYSFKAESGEMLDGKGFHVVTLWGPMADVAGKYVKPGSQLFISGRLQTDSWQDEKTNEKRSKTKMVALDMIILDPKEGQQAAPEGAASIVQCLNRADIIGNVTRDPEMRTTTSGQKVLTLGVATNEKWKDRASGEMKERVEFHNVVLWGALADQAAKFAKKGGRVYVTGRVQTRTWETKEGGKRTTTEIIGDAISLLGVSNKAVQNNISNEARSSAPSASQQSDSGSAPQMSQDAAMESPSLTYASEVRAEDLPF